MFGYGYGGDAGGGDRVSAMMDMINGGGAGRAGQQFEGGGLLSMLGNVLAQPYGAEARGMNAPDASMRPVMRPQGRRPQGRRLQAPMPQQPMPQQPMPTGLSPLEMFGGQAPAPYTPPDLQYSGRGTTGMFYPAWVQDDATRQVFDILRAHGVPGY